MNISETQESLIEKYPTRTSSNPIVTVLVTAYQHAKYIKQCLDSILAQNVNFDFEILVGEDDSSDGTRETCVAYAQKYPNKIRLLLHNRKNVISVNGNPTGRFNFLYGIQNVRGKYVAWCDGDDYWIDKNKLQKQVDFLSTHHEYSMCFNNALIDFDDHDGARKTKPLFTNRHSGTYSSRRLLRKDEIPTSGIVFRTTAIQGLSDWWVQEFPFADWPIEIHLAQRGRLYYFDDIMSVYRQHGTGLSGRRSEDEKYEIAFIHQHIRFRVALLDSNILNRRSIRLGIADNYYTLAGIMKRSGKTTREMWMLVKGFLSWPTPINFMKMLAVGVYIHIV